MLPSKIFKRAKPIALFIVILFSWSFFLPHSNDIIPFLLETVMFFCGLVNFCNGSITSFL
jgi:hypothetical protein